MKTREDFTAGLDLSQQVAQQVCEFMDLSGFDCEVLPHTVTPNEQDRWQHTDNGDIQVRMRVEVKYRPDIHFHSVDTFPFDSIIIDESYKVHGRHNTLLACLTVNASRTGMLYIGRETRDHWFEQEIFDKKEGRTCKCFMCPTKLAHYMAFPQRT